MAIETNFAAVVVCVVVVVVRDIIRLMLFEVKNRNP